MQAIAKVCACLYYNPYYLIHHAGQPSTQLQLYATFLAFAIYVVSTDITMYVAK